MSDYIKLAEAPTLTINMPTCGSCVVEVDADADGLICPCCGTMWSHKDGEGDAGELYEEWSGEDLDSEPLNEDEAFNAGMAYEDAEHEAMKDRVRMWADKQKFLAEAMADPEGHRLVDEMLNLPTVIK